MTLTKEELIRRLGELAEIWDLERSHVAADKLLLQYINDPDITEAFERIDKWYA